MLVLCAGGCGCKAANRLRLREDDKVVAIGAPSDVSIVKRENVPRITVDAGSDTGAHRRYEVAYKQLANQLDGIIEEAKKAVRQEVPVAVVFGIGGAVGAAVAKHVIQHIPAAIVATLPAPDEPERSHAAKQFLWLAEAKRFKNCPVYLYENQERGEIELDMVARKVHKLRNYSPLDFPNLARVKVGRVIFLDDEPVDISDVVQFLRVSDAKFKGALEGPVASDNKFELELEDKYEKRDDDLDPLSFL